jgi:hypothetical protein
MCGFFVVKRPFILGEINLCLWKSELEGREGENRQAGGSDFREGVKQVRGGPEEVGKAEMKT